MSIEAFNEALTAEREARNVGDEVRYATGWRAMRVMEVRPPREDDRVIGEDVATLQWEAEDGVTRTAYASVDRLERVRG